MNLDYKIYVLGDIKMNEIGKMILNNHNYELN
jgi:hypothetical protein